MMKLFFWPEGFWWQLLLSFHTIPYDDHMKITLLATSQFLLSTPDWPEMTNEQVEHRINLLNPNPFYIIGQWVHFSIFYPASATLVASLFAGFGVTRKNLMLLSVEQVSYSSPVHSQCCLHALCTCSMIFASPNQRAVGWRWYRLAVLLLGYRPAVLLCVCQAISWQSYSVCQLVLKRTCSSLLFSESLDEVSISATSSMTCLSCPQWVFWELSPEWSSFLQLDWNWGTS